MPFESSVAAMNAVAAWPDGNDDVIGRRIPYGSGASWVKCSWGRTRRKSDFTAPLVSRDSAPSSAPSFSAIAGSPVRAARTDPIASHRSPWSAALDRP